MKHSFVSAARSGPGGAAPPPGDRRPRWRRRKDARPSEILDAALVEFVERGYAAARLEDVARRAGVTKGTLYLYFDGKEALFKATARAAVLPSVEAGEERVRSHTGTARELVTDILRIRWDRVFNSPAGGILKLLISEAGNFPDLARWYHDEIVVRANASLEQALELGIQRGEFRRLDIQQAVYLALAPAVMAGLWKRSFMRAVQPPFDPADYLENWIQTFLRGIESRPQREESHA